MSDLRITVNSKEVAAMLAQLPRALREKGLRSGLHAAAVELQAQIRQELSGRTLKRRTGRYYRSIRVTGVRFDETGAHVSVQSTWPGARAHEEGLVIRPRKRQFLAIPFSGTPIGLKVPAALRQGAFIYEGTVYSKWAVQPLFSFKRFVKMPNRPIWSIVSRRSREITRYFVSVALDRVIQERNKK